MADAPQSAWGGRQGSVSGGGSAWSGRPAPGAGAPAGGGGGGFLHTVGKVLGTGADIVTLGGSGTLGVPTYIPTKVSPLGVGLNLAKDVGNTAIQLGPGAVKFGGDLLKSGEMFAQHPLRPMPWGQDPLTADINGFGQQYKQFYDSPHVLSHLYQHPLQPILDALTVADVGASGAAKLGQLGKLGRVSDAAAGLGERANLVTRSPGAVFNQPDTRFVAHPDGTIEPVDLGGGGPVHVAYSSTAPLAKLSQVAASKLRARFPEGAVTLGDKVIHPLPSEFRQYGKQVRHAAEQASLEHLEPYRPYFQAVKRLTTSEWAALQIRAMDIHPSDLRVLWHGTPDERWLTPKVRELVMGPSKRMQAAEGAARDLSKAGADLLGSELSAETAAFRPVLPKALAEAGLGRPPREITGEPYYMPHVQEPVKGGASPLASRGGGKAPVRSLGTTKFNTGTLFAHGRLYLHGDVLGPEFLRRVKWRRYEAIHDALLRGSVRLTKDELRDQFGGLPKGWEYVREKPSTRIPFTLRGESEDEILKHLVPNEHGTFRRGEAATGVYAGFSTRNAEEAFSAPGSDVFHVVPSVTAKAATGEFTRTNQFVHAFLHKPLAVWRSIVLGLRVGFLTNNLVGNAVMYFVRTGGRGALRDLFGAILETHGYGVGRRILADKATPPELAAELRAEFDLGPEPQAGLVVARRAAASNFPEGTLFHGSPEGDIAKVDALHHTRAWREGQGFYLTPSAEKAAKYAAGKTARGERKAAATSEGKVLGYRLKPDAKVLNVDEQPVSFWQGLAEQITGDKVDPATWRQWASDVNERDLPASRGASEGVLNRMRLMEYLTGYHEMPGQEAYYAVEEALASHGIQATLHHEAGVPVYVVKDENALERVQPTPGLPRAAGVLGPKVEGPRNAMLRPAPASPAFHSPPPAHEDFYATHYPEQGRSATFGHTQSPAVSGLTVAKNRVTQGARDVTGAIPQLTAKVAEEYPRRGLVRHFIRTSPEFRRVYKALPRQERTFLAAAEKILSGKLDGVDSAAYRDRISQQVNGALGDYLHLGAFERVVMRNTLPFYSWYRAIVTTTGHLALEDPLRALILTKLAAVGQEWTDKELGQLPSFLRGVIPLGHGPGGTERVLSTSALNPYATLTQVGGGDVTSVGLNPFLLALLEEYARQAETQHSSLPHVNIAAEIANALGSVVTGLPPAQIISPTPPSKLYPYRNRLSTILSQAGAPIKDVNLDVAHQQAAAGR